MTRPDPRSIQSPSPRGAQSPSPRGAQTPDPYTAPRRPMVRAGAGRRPQAPPRRGRALFAADGRLDVDALHQVVELADAISEGLAYPMPDGGEQFLGSTALILDVEAAGLAPLCTEDLGRLARALTEDGRCRLVVRDRIYRELARLLGADTPERFDLEVTQRVEGVRVRLVGDFEAPLPRRAVTDGHA